MSDLPGSVAPQAFLQALLEIANGINAQTQVIGDAVAVANPLPVNEGGTGQTTYLPGELLIGNNLGGLSKSPLTAGSGITITNGDGSITVGLVNPLPADQGGTGETVYLPGQLLIGNDSGGLSKWTPLPAMDSPFPTPHIHAVNARAVFELSATPALFLKADGKLTFIYRQGPGHLTSFGTGVPTPEVVAVDTDDFGQQISTDRPAITPDPLYDYRNFAIGLMDSGRWGILSRKQQEVPPYDGPVFFYSDDELATPMQSVQLTLGPGLPVNFASNPHGWINRYPTVVGGNDSTGWIAYIYSQNVLAYATTVDNGATWSDVTLALDPGTTANEMAIARNGDALEWVMIIRSTSSVSLIATSVDMKNWTLSGESGVTVGANPPYFIQEEGSSEAWLIIPSRSVPLISGIKSHLLLARVDVAALYADRLQGIGEWNVVAGLPNIGIGYISNPVKIQGQYVVLLAGGDQNFSTETSSVLAMLTNWPVVASTPYGTLQQLPVPSIAPNSDAQLWTGGTPITGLAARTTGADNWGWQRVTSATDYTISQQPGSRGYTQRVQRDNGTSDTSVINGIHMLDPDDVVRLRGQLIVVTVRARGGSDFSPVAGTVEIDVFSNATNGAVTMDDGDKIDNVQLGDTLSMSIGEDWTEDSVLGRVLTDAAMVYVRFQWTPNGTAGTDDWVEFEQVRVTADAVSRSYSPRPIAIESAMITNIALQSYW